MSLRLRLLISLVSLVLVGLLVADVVTYVSLRSFLVKRIDQQLVAAQRPMINQLITAGNDYLPPPGVTSNDSMPPGTYGEIVDQSGKTVGEPIAFTYDGKTPPAPVLPARLKHKTGQQRALLVSVRASGDSSLHYRLLAAPLPGGVYTLIVATPLTEVSKTLGRLFMVELIVTLAVLLGLASLAWFIVRREMRPLEDMASTAGAIAGGDLTQRIERADSRSEVGRLGLALNVMLAQIEQAFAKRTASEDKLRRFLAQASHELRTPLASVRGYAELFRRGAKDRPEDLELAMRRIEQEAVRMGVLVEELLLLSRLDEGRPLDRAPVDLAQVATDVVADARITAADREITLSAPEPVVVLGDEVRLRQLATNLITNALQHAGPEAHVHVSTRSAGTWAELAVKDDGFGMAQDELERIFEPFYRPAGTQAGASGAGLGLSIVAAVAESHGGHVNLETEPGQGASFTVVIPLAQAEPGELESDSGSCSEVDAEPQTDAEPQDETDAEL